MVATGSRGLTLSGSGRLRLLGNYHLRPVLQLLKTAGSNHVSRVNASHGGLPRVRYPDLDVADLGRVILNEVDK